MKTIISWAVFALGIILLIISGICLAEIISGIIYCFGDDKAMTEFINSGNYSWFVVCLGISFPFGMGALLASVFIYDPEGSLDTFHYYFQVF